MTNLERKIFEITVDWNKWEDNMGENAALEVACEQRGVSSQWYYDNLFDCHEVVNKELKKLYGQD